MTMDPRSPQQQMARGRPSMTWNLVIALMVLQSGKY